MPVMETEKIACLATLARVAKLNGDPTPPEFEAFLTALGTFHPLPPGATPEHLLGDTTPLDHWLGQIQTPELQQQVYRSAHTILRSKGIDPQESALLEHLQAIFQLTPAVATALAKQPLRATTSAGWVNSTLSGMAALIGREGDVRRLVFDYSLGAAIVGLIPLRGGGSLEIKLLIVVALIVKMLGDIRNLWGQPTGQGVLAIVGAAFGLGGAVFGGLLVWVGMVGLGVVIPYAGAFDKAIGFATATWIAGQTMNQFYTSQPRPDLGALKRAFPQLIDSDSRSANK
ncbi:MAG: hypothetical protein ACFCVD_03125 [Nodosilinea sp.]